MSATQPWASELESLREMPVSRHKELDALHLRDVRVHYALYTAVPMCGGERLNLVVGLSPQTSSPLWRARRTTKL
eukprot:scaffold40515_cov61-Phaeocystis_antarctica.AAC.2